jgi:hypothetical protein
MGMLMHKNIRNNGELNVSTQIHREVSNRAITGKPLNPLNPFCPMTVRGNRNVLDEIIAFYKAEKVGVYKKDILAQVNKDYIRNKLYFSLICKNYLKMMDDTKIRDFYNSFWKIIVDDYGNLNIEYSQRANIILWIPLFYKYNKLDFFKNIYLVNSLSLEVFSASEFMKYVLKPTSNQAINDDWENYRYIVYGCDIITNIFQQPDITFYESTDYLNKIKLLLYYIIEYNNPDVNKYYEDFANTISQSVTNALFSMYDAMQEGASATEALEAMFSRLLRQLAEMAIKAAIFSAIMSAVSGGAAGGGVSFIGAFKKILGLASGGVATGPTLEGSESEAVLPLSKLGNIMQSSFNSGSMSGYGGGNSGGQFVLRGQDLLLATNRAQKASNLKGQSISLA